jgi:RNA polymerase sigma-70 factor (sigma-E family)
MSHPAVPHSALARPAAPRLASPRSGRDEEFSAFVAERRPELLRSACLLTAGDTHFAEDLVQTALARLYVAWPRVRRQGTQAAYAWRIIVNAHLDEVRRPRWRRERSVPELPETSAGDQPDGLPAGLDADRVKAALAALPAGMRAAVVLRHWLDLSVEETASLLGCTPGTVKSQTAKGAARLRELLTQASTGPASTAPASTVPPSTGRKH